MHTLTKLAVPQGSAGIHWFEQNSYAIKDSHGTIVLVDPYFPHKRPAETFVHSEPPLDESQLPTNYVLLTHSHSDHTCSETLSRIHKSWPGAKYVGPRESIAKILEETDIDGNHTITVAAGEAAQLGTMTAHAVYAKPPDGDPEAGIKRPDVTHLGYVVEADGVKLYFSGDEINTFANLDDMIAPVAALHPDIGFVTMHPTEGEFPFVDGSIKMAQRIGLKTIVPAHYSCFVRRDYEPQEWAEQFPTDGPRPLIIPPNSHIVYPAAL
ncbi:MBL fold metallo-hydrolase [Candidatus Poribacteria bacterium]